MSWFYDDDEDWYWYDAPYEVWDEDWYGEFFVCMCYGEYEARWYERRGYLVYEPAPKYRRW
jgi:hypothetical protein